MPVSEREFGELVERVSNMQRAVGDLKTNVATIGDSVEQILRKISGLEGGWRVLLGIAGVAGVVGGIIVKVLPLGFHF